MMFASSYMTALVYLLACSGPAQPEVKVKVVPDRSQHFLHDSISVSCEEQSSSETFWAVKRNTSQETKASCDDWGKTGESCTIKSAYTSDHGVYWCQSNTQQVSRSVNITICGGDVILDSPVHPVPEGSDITLRCLYKTPGQPSSFDLPADFYRNGSLFSSQPTGQMTILHVNKSDEGLYNCSISGLGPSVGSWLDVTNSSSISDPSCEAEEEEEEALITGKQVIIKILVFTPYFVSTLLYFSILRDRARAAAAANARRRRDNDDVIMEVAE